MTLMMESIDFYACIILLPKLINKPDLKKENKTQHSSIKIHVQKLVTCSSLCILEIGNLECSLVMVVPTDKKNNNQHYIYTTQP